eukprot:13196085-Alexandrium_andersonii.AAC.1
MSASLVGSEMCIRDRSRLQQTAFVLARWGPQCSGDCRKELLPLVRMPRGAVASEQRDDRMDARTPLQVR